MRRYIASLLLVLSASVAFVALSASSAGAVSSGCYFGSGQCSISGNGAYGSNDIFTGRSSTGSGSAMGSVNSKSDFISYIKNRFNGSAHNKTGAQFIIKNMLDGVSGRPDRDDLDRWVAIMQQDDVHFSIDRNNSVAKTSWYVPGKNDVIHDTAYEGGPRIRDVIHIKQSGTIVAEIEIACGNLTATHAHLEGSGWEIKPTTTVTPTQVRPGQVIHWTHKAQNLGPENTDENVAWEVWQYIKSSPAAPNTGGTKPASGTITKPRVKGYTMTKATTYTAKASDVGKYICQYIRVKPFKKPPGNVWKYSPLKCAKVTNNPVSDDSPCDPIEVTVNPTERDWQGNIVQVQVYSYKGGAQYRYIGSAASKQQFTITAHHTTGDTYGIYMIVPRYAYDRQAQYDADGNFIGYQYYYRAQHTTFVKSVGPCYDYRIDPSVEATPDKAEAGADINVMSTIENSDLSGQVAGNVPPQSKTDGDISWWLSAIVYSPGSNVESDGGPHDSGSDACGDSTFPSSNRVSCGMIEGKWSSNPKPDIPIGKPSIYKVPDDTPAGTRICFVVTVEKPTQEDDPAYRNSNIACIHVGKRPKLQIHGSDLRSRAATTTSTSTIGGKTYGSWVEYGGLSLNVDNALGSGSGLKDGNPSPARDAWSTLTFANAGSYGSVGMGSWPPTPWNTVKTTMEHRDLCTSHSISYAELQPGDSKVICVSGNVTITNDIKQSDDSIRSLDKIPQMIIIADNINIQADVGRIDAWLVASGTINTCSNQSGSTVDSCDKQLIINGPVMANKLVTKRTYGADSSDRDEPAEIINMRPDSYLWLYGGMGKLGSNTAVETVQITEIPPRF